MFKIGIALEYRFYCHNNFYRLKNILCSDKVVTDTQTTMSVQVSPQKFLSLDKYSLIFLREDNGETMKRILQ